MSAPGGQGHRDYELVRVSREMVERLIEDDSEPVVVMRLQRHEDGTCELWLQNAPVVSELERLRSALATVDACMEWCVNLGADEATAKSLRHGMAVAREALSGPAPNEDRG